MTLPFALLLAGALQGCSSGPQFFGHRDQTSRHEPGSDAWWAEKGALPSGVRQKCKKGKVWPARPRSTQEPQPLVHTFYSQHYWPLPYSCQDEQAVWANIEHQTALGWQQETTIYDRHFDSMTQQLTKAGELHLSYIMHVVPQERRAVFIQSTYDPALDALRTESVNTVMSKMHYNDSITVTVRDCQEVGRPAAEVQMINQMYRDTTPAPRLGNAGSGNDGSSGGEQGTGG